MDLVCLLSVYTLEVSLDAPDRRVGRKQEEIIMLSIRVLAFALLGVLATGPLQAKQGESLHDRGETRLEQTQQTQDSGVEKSRPRYGIKGDLLGEEERRLPYRRAESDRPRDH